MAKAKSDPSPAPRNLAKLHIWHVQAVRDILLIAAVIGLVWLGYVMRSVTVPLLVALLLAYLFEPLVALLTRRGRVGRPFVAGAIIATVGVAVVGLLAILVPVAVDQTSEIIAKFGDGRARAAAISLAQHVPPSFRDDLERVIKLLPDGVQQAGREGPPAPDAAVGDAAVGASAARRHDLVELALGGVRAVMQVLGRVVQLGFLAFLIPFYFFFFSVSYPAVAGFARSLVPEEGRARTFELLGKMDRVVASFIRGRIVISVLMGAMLALGWRLCGVNYALLLGAVVGIFSAVPYLGGVGIPLAIGLLAAEQFTLPLELRMVWWQVILWPTVVFVIVQVIETYVLTPVIAGKATNLDPVTIVVAVLAGGSIMGVYGMLLAIPVTACLKILLTDVLLPRIRAWTRGEAEDPLPMGR